MGNGYFRTTCEFALRRADVEGLSGSAHAAQEFGRTDENRSVEAGLDRCARPVGDHFAALYGTPGLRQLRHLFRVWLSGESALELGGHGVAHCREDRTLRDPREELCPRDLGG